MVASTAALVAGMIFALRYRDQLEALAIGQSWILLFGLAAVGATGYGVISFFLGAIRARDFKNGTG